MYAWIMLVAAGLLEVVWAIALKRSDGFSNVVATVVFAVASLGSFLLLARALKDLPVGTGYAVWTGIGAVGAAIVGMVWLNEQVSVPRIASLALVLSGIIGLAATSQTTH